MPLNPWKAPDYVLDLVDALRREHHLPRLEDARICTAFDDSKPFVRNQLNLGKVVKFSGLNKLWHGREYDFCVVICSTVWHDILVGEQREAYLDLQLTRCEVEYEPVRVVVEDGKRGKVVKDEWGRVEYTDVPRFDESGNPKWKVVPLSLPVFVRNIRRYGLWYQDLVEVKAAIQASPVMAEASSEPETV